MSQAPHYEDVAEVLRRAGYNDTAALYHGAVCGSLCMVERDALDLAALIDAGGGAASDPEGMAVLETLRDRSNDDLLSTEMSFAPLLPDDEMPLSVRVEALSAWCEGFLYGFSCHRQLDLGTCSEEAQETLRDFTQFTQAGFDPGGEPEAEEAAYTELVEYIRVGAQLLFLELRPRPPMAAESSSVH